MKLIIAVIQPHRLEKVRESLTAIGIDTKEVRVVSDIEADIVAANRQIAQRDSSC